ncbi:hypothetical protein QMA00_18160 [Pseudoalteromonas sp. APC 3694]|nr:hypothetical protein [Pseudoalteromonas sp. APC 3694]MDN3490946.1 hypothetical protein [Pseudoalteromonas sp. APC 3694]
MFQQLKDSNDPQAIAFADYKQYSPSYNAPASFIGKPIVVDGKTIAILAAQLSIEDVNSIMKERGGLGISSPIMVQRTERGPSDGVGPGCSDIVNLATHS